jgi:DNA-binding PadR family transcriptional regulator
VKPLRTTSYALLGLLYSKSLSASELADHMAQGSLASLWPRAQSAIYQEPKNLEAHGLATSSKQRVDGRNRSVYRITPKGRKAFRVWLDRDLGGPSLECERFVQLALASGGTIEQVRSRVEHHREELEAWRETALAGLRGILERGPSFPERIHLTGCIADYLTERIAFEERWAADLARRIEAWPVARADDDLMAEGEALIRDCIRRLAESSGESDT